MHIEKDKHVKLIVQVLLITMGLFFVFQLNLLSAFAATDDNRSSMRSIDGEKNILVLQSYHKGHEWSDREGNAILETLVKSDLEVATFLEYMDWKRYPDEKNLQLLYERYQYKYSRKKIDLIVTTDDAALKFALEHREKLFSDAPVVFSGVLKQDADILLQGYNNVTGVYQTIDPLGTIRAAKQMIPDLNKIYIVHDKSESGISTGNIIKKAAHNSDRDLMLSDLSDCSLEQLLAVVQVLDQDSIVFLASYNSDINHIFLPIQDFAERISKKSSVPVFTIDEGILGAGSIGGSLTNAEEHGKRAADMGLRILNGEAADSIAIDDLKSVYWGFDYLELKRYAIPLDRLPEDSRVINKPFSFYETYKAFVISNIAIIIILFIFIIYLLINLNYRKKIEKTLSRQKEENYNLAYYSPVTGLPNRINLKETLEKIIQSDTEKRENFALIYIDIDNFKEVNDTFGHIVGDRVLFCFAQRLNEMNGITDNAFSLGGDEFIVLIQDIANNSVEDMVEELFENLAKPFFIDDNIFYITVSGGIVSYPAHGENYIDLLKNADTAMYRTKELGKASFTFFDQSMSDEAVKKAKMQSNLRRAIE